MDITRSRGRSILWGSLAFAIVAALLIVFFYPVSDGYSRLLLLVELPNFTRIWKAELHNTVTVYVTLELGLALFLGACVYWLLEDLVRPRDVGI